MAVSPYPSVEAYIHSFDGNVRDKLSQLRALIRQAAPQAQEKLSWGAPAYWQHGFVTQFSACKRHIGFYTSPAAIAHFAQRLEGYQTNTKNTVRLPLDAPLPAELIGEMVRFQVTQNSKSAATDITK